MRKTNNDLRARERERDAAEWRVSAAQAESERGATASTASAAAKRVSPMLLLFLMSSSLASLSVSNVRTFQLGMHRNHQLRLIFQRPCNSLTSRDAVGIADLS